MSSDLPLETQAELLQSQVDHYEAVLKTLAGQLPSASTMKTRLEMVRHINRALQDNPTRWHLELRVSETGEPLDTDHFTGTEEAALKEARSWLREALTMDNRQKEILVIDELTGTYSYQGNFNMRPGENPLD